MLFPLLKINKQINKKNINKQKDDDKGKFFLVEELPNYCKRAKFTQKKYKKKFLF